MRERWFPKEKEELLSPEEGSGTTAESATCPPLNTHRVYTHGHPLLPTHVISQCPTPRGGPARTQYTHTCLSAPGAAPRTTNLRLRDSLNHRKHGPCAEQGADGADTRARVPAEKSAHVEISKWSSLRRVSHAPLPEGHEDSVLPSVLTGAPTSANSPCPLFPMAICSRGLGDGSRSEACVALKPASCWHN